MAETENNTEADDNTGSIKQHDKGDSTAKTETHDSATARSGRTLSLGTDLLRNLRKGVEFCGKHPFATGMFALVSLAGLILSVIGFQRDRQEAVSTTEQVHRVESKLEDISETIGTSFRGGIFLYEEPLEGVYWNEWWAHPLKSEEEIKKYGQADLTIRGEGKTVDYVGLLSMNCSNGKYFWRGVENFYTPVASDEKIAELVPNQVIKNVYRLFCRSP